MTHKLNSTAVKAQRTEPLQVYKILTEKKL